MVDQDSRPFVRQKMPVLEKLCNKPKDRSAVLTKLISDVCGNPLEVSDNCKLPIKFFAVPSFNVQVRSEQLRSNRLDEDKKFLFVVLNRKTVRSEYDTGAAETRAAFGSYLIPRMSVCRSVTDVFAAVASGASGTPLQSRTLRAERLTR